MGLGKKARDGLRKGFDKAADIAQESARKARELAEREAREAKERAKLAKARAEREAREATEELQREAREAREKLERETRETKEKLEREAREARQNARGAKAKLEREAREKAARLEREAREKAAKLEREAREEAARKGQGAREKKSRLEQAARDTKERTVAQADRSIERATNSVRELADGAKATLRRLDVKIWPTNTASFAFPEAGDAKLQRRRNIGLAISGGGTRSMSLSVGYMRALMEQGVLDQTRYIGAISGGAWVAIPYAYLPARISDEQFFGSDLPPEALNREALSRITPRDGLLAGRIAASELLFPLLSGLVASRLARSLSLPPVPFAKIRFGLDDIDEQWGRALGGIFLKPLGIDGDRYASWRREHASDVIDRNTNIVGQHRLDMDDFVVQEQDRPYLCVNGAVNQDAYLIPDDPKEKWRPLGWRSWEHCEFTPMYSGIHRHSRGSAKLNMGGGYVENVGIDTVFPVAKGAFVNVSTGLDHHRFAPQDMMAISGAAPAYITHGLVPFLRMGSIPGASVLGQAFEVMPKLRQWPVQFLGKPIVREQCFGDGGYVDNYGIIPLLKRKVEKIIVLINTDIPLGQHETSVLGDDPECDTFLHTLFGVNTGKSLSLASPSDFLQPGRFLGRENGQVFDEAALRPLLKAMIENRQAGRPTFHKGRYTTLHNEFFGIPSGHRCEILWIYNDLFAAWYDRLPAETRELFKGGRDARAGLASFPHLPTGLTKSDSQNESLDVHVLKAFNEGGIKGAINHIDRIVDLDSYQVKLAASHAYHVANELRNEIARLIGN